MNVKDSYLTHVLSHYFPNDHWKIIAVKGGVNNTTSFVNVNGDQYVLRIYETHQDVEKVKFEHEVLLALQDVTRDFLTPVPIFTRDHSTLVKAPDGKIAALFRFMDGENPDLNDFSQIRSYGKTAGQLSCALANIHIQQRPAYRPYYELESSHPRCSLEDVLDFCMSPPLEFEECSSELLILASQLTAYKQHVSTLTQLPHQLVHGDLNASNILQNQFGNITAVLDFEFVTNDLRVMELAVCLSDFIRPPHDETLFWAKIELFLSGYGSVIQLRQDEIDALPLLIQLRSLDVFIHFLGRYRDHIEPVENLKQTIQKSAERIEWVKMKQDDFLPLCTQYLS